MAAKIGTNDRTAQAPPLQVGQSLVFVGAMLASSHAPRAALYGIQTRRFYSPPPSDPAPRGVLDGLGRMFDNRAGFAGVGGTGIPATASSRRLHPGSPSGDQCFLRVFSVFCMQGNLHMQVDAPNVASIAPDDYEAVSVSRAGSSAGTKGRGLQL